MNCPLCGDVCRCSPEPDSPVLPRWMPDAADASASSRVLRSSPSAVAETQLIDPEAVDLSEQRFVASLEAGVAAPASQEDEIETSREAQPEEEVPDTKNSEDALAAPLDAGDEDGSAWREELSARLSQYRSRRKVRPPRYPSLRLPFDEPLRSVLPSASQPSTSDFFNAPSTSALTPDFVEPAAPRSHTEASVPRFVPVMSAAAPALAPSQSSMHAGAKIIEFPRSTEQPPPRPADELAEPVMERPRILEVPEVTPPPPALGGINMEAIQHDEVEKRLGIDAPLQSVPLARRMLATAIDGLIIVAASALFGFIFWNVAAVRPPQLQILGLAAAVPSLFWAAYQYLMVVYSGSTPGLRLAGLEINRFDGMVTSRRLRRWRVLASYLSAASLGMGYAWVFLDEDSLCWHDRTTHTYLALKSPRV